MAHASVLASRPLGGMVPDPALLTPAHETELIRADGRPQPAFREQLRKIPSWRNAWSVLSVWLQAALILGLAVWWGNPAGYVVAFLLMGRTQAQLASLMHESAHRLLFANRRLNDFVGRWLLGYPAYTSTDAYRRVHMAHHRQEFGPDEPDIPLYAGYPITRASFRRKLVRDATGQTGFKLFRAQAAGFRSADPRVRHTLWKILSVQAVLLGAAIVGRVLVAVPGVLVAAVPHRVAGDQPSPFDRRTRRDGRVAGPPRDHAHRATVLVVPHRPRAVQHRVAPRPPRRRRHLDAPPAPRTTERSAMPGTSRRSSNTPATGRCGGHCARVPALPQLRVRKVGPWSAGFRTRGAWSS